MGGEHCTRNITNVQCLLEFASNRIVSVIGKLFTLLNTQIVIHVLLTTYIYMYMHMYRPSITTSTSIHVHTCTC